MDTGALALGIFIGMIVGALAALLAAHIRGGRERQALEQRAVKAETAAAEAEKRIAEQRELLSATEQQIRDTFRALALDALKETRQDLLQSAEERLTGVVQPVRQALAEVAQRAQEMEEKRSTAYGSLEEQLKALGEMQQNLQQEARNLANSLRRPQVRGRWGEITLRNLAELAGMSAYCDFEEQVSTTTENGRLRPDMVVKLPGGRTVVVDSKVPLEAYLDAIEAPNDETARARLEAHARHVRDHVNTLASRGYQERFESLEVVVMFIPGEAFFSAAPEADRQLLDYALQKRVVLASPATLFTMLSTVGHMWRQAEMAANAQAMVAAGQELHKRMGVLVDHLARIRKGLEGAVEAYNSAAGSLESRVMPAARRMQELGVRGDPLPDVAPIDRALRRLAAEPPPEAAEEEAEPK